MKIPDKTVPFLFLLLLVGAFLLGRYQGQLEVLKGGQSSRQTAQTQTDNQAGVQPGALGPTGQTQPGNVNLSGDQWQAIVKDAIYLKGSGDAPVAVVEFTDYQCPYCAQFFNQTFPQIEKDYIDTGRVRYLVRDFPLPFHANAHAAAQAARCAGDQEKYLEMHDLLFEKQGEWSNEQSKDKLVSYGSDLGLKRDSFSNCIESGKYKDAVDKDLALSQQLGVGGTPGFYINGKLLVGAQPFESFKQAIEAEL